MRIVKIEDLRCNAGWSEIMENFGSADLGTVIGRLGERLIGQDPRPIEKHIAFQRGVTRQALGGMNQQAIAAIENALADIKAKFGIVQDCCDGGCL